MTLADAVLVTRLALGALFSLAAAGKLAGRKPAGEALAAFGVPPPLVGPVAAGLPIVELGVAALLVQDRREVAETYRTTATPSAVLIGAGGRIASPVAAGGDDIFKLLLRAPEIDLAGATQPEGELDGRAL